MERSSENFSGLEDVRELFWAYYSSKNPRLGVKSLGSSIRCVDVQCPRGQVPWHPITNVCTRAVRLDHR